MISSLNAYGGLSANELLSLFGANSSSASSSSSNSTSTGSVLPSPTDASASSGNNPISSIKAILAELQISHVSANGGWTFAEKAEMAYVNQMSTGGLLPSTNNIADVTNLGFLSDAETYSSINTSTGQAGFGSTDQTVYHGFTLNRSDSVVVTSGDFSPDTTSTQASSANPNSTSTGTGTANSAYSSDYFQLSGSMGLQSADKSLALNLNLGFSVAGLGTITALPDSNVVQAHAVDAEHNYTDFFQINMFANGEMNNITVNIQGLDATQAQDIMTSFQKSAADDNIAQYTGPNYNPNLSVNYMAGSFTSDSELAQGQT